MCCQALAMLLYAQCFCHLLAVLKMLLHNIYRLMQAYIDPGGLVIL